MANYIDGKITGEMIIVEVCRQYHWDYHTYLAQPKWFLDMIIEKMKIDAKKQKAREEAIKHKT